MTEIAKNRLLSLDALRGFDMIWIIGLDGLIHSLTASGNSGWLNWMSVQMEHAPAGSFYFYDLIFHCSCLCLEWQFPMAC